MTSTILGKRTVPSTRVASSAKGKQRGHYVIASQCKHRYGKILRIHENSYLNNDNGFHERLALEQAVFLWFASYRPGFLAVEHNEVTSIPANHLGSNGQFDLSALKDLTSKGIRSMLAWAKVWETIARCCYAAIGFTPLTDCASLAASKLSWEYMIHEILGLNYQSPLSVQGSSAHADRMVWLRTELNPKSESFVQFKRLNPARLATGSEISQIAQIVLAIPDARLKYGHFDITFHVSGRYKELPQGQTVQIFIELCTSGPRPIPYFTLPIIEPFEEDLVWMLLRQSELERVDHCAARTCPLDVQSVIEAIFDQNLHSGCKGMSYNTSLAGLAGTNLAVIYKNIWTSPSNACLVSSMPIVRWGPVRHEP